MALGIACAGTGNRVSCYSFSKIITFVLKNKFVRFIYNPKQICFVICLYSSTLIKINNTRYISISYTVIFV